MYNSRSVAMNKYIFNSKRNKMHTNFKKMQNNKKLQIFFFYQNARVLSITISTHKWKIIVCDWKQIKNVLKITKHKHKVFVNTITSGLKKPATDAKEFPQ